MINREKLIGQLTLALAETMEYIVFSETELCEPDGMEFWGTTPYWASITVLKPERYCMKLTITATRSLLEEIAGRIYAEMAAESLNDRELLADTLAELINIISGRLMNILLPEEAFELSLPVTGTGLMTDSKAQTWCFSVIDHNFTFMISEIGNK